MTSVRRCQKFPLCLTDPMPSDPRMDPLLKEGKSISDGDSALGLTCIRRGKFAVQQHMNMERGVRICETHLQQRHRHQGDLSGSRAEIFLQPGMQTTMRQLCSSRPWKSVVEHKFACSLGGPHSEQAPE